jgi:hypothetical protein
VAPSRAGRRGEFGVEVDEHGTRHVPGLVVCAPGRPAEAPPDVEHHRCHTAARCAPQQGGQVGGLQ